MNRETTGLSEIQPISYKVATSVVYKIGLERHTKFEFAGMMDTTSLYHCSKFELCVQFLETFMSN